MKHLSLTGAAIQIGLEEEPPFAVGDQVTLILHFEAQRSVQLGAIIQSENDLSGGGRQFDVAFVNPSALRAKLPGSLLRSFNERSAFRVGLNVPVPVVLHLVSPPLQASGQMRDLSVAGFGVAMDSDPGPRLVPGVWLTAEFTLPGQELLLRLQASIRSLRSTKKGVVVIGLRFEEEGSSDFTAQLRSVTNYVMNRQREWLQSRVEII